MVKHPFGNPFDSDFNDYEFEWYHWMDYWNGKYRKYMHIISNKVKQRNLDGHTSNFQLNDMRNIKL